MAGSMGWVLDLPGQRRSAILRLTLDDGVWLLLESAGEALVLPRGATAQGLVLAIGALGREDDLEAGPSLARELDEGDPDFALISGSSRTPKPSPRTSPSRSGFSPASANWRRRWLRVFLWALNVLLRSCTRASCRADLICLISCRHTVRMILPR